MRLKLLEIYAARKDLRSFETQAGELYSMTRGQGEEWQQAAGMGLQIDPANPLYGSGEQPLNLGAVGVAGAAGAAAAVSQSDLAQQLAASFASSGAQPETAHFDLHALDADDLTALPHAAVPLDDDQSLDFDLGGLDFEPASAPPVPAEVSYAMPATAAAFDATAVPDMDFFHNDAAAVAAPAAVEATPQADPFDIDFDMNFDTPAPAAATPAPAPAAVPADPFADFDLASLPGEPTAAPERAVQERAAQETAAQESAATAAPLFDIDAMDFDLPPAPPPAPVTLSKPAPAPDTSFIQDDLPALTPPAERSAAAPAFDMSGIDLELPAFDATVAPHADDDFGVDFPFDRPAPAPASGATGALDDGANSVMSSALMEMETKLDLALAYQEIGDKEGARELLDEVIKGGNIEQVSKANAMRAQLA